MEDIITTLQEAQKRLEDYKLKRPVIICHKEDEDLFKKYCPGANIITVSDAPKKGVYIVETDPTKLINHWRESEGENESIRN